jgi:hypothetical protein
MDEQRNTRRRRPQPQGQRLRKQPTVRRVQSAQAIRMPRVATPDTPKVPRRPRQRQRQQGNFSWGWLRTFVFSARWMSLGLLSLTLFALYLAGTEQAFYLTTVPVSGAVSIPPGEIVSASGLGGAHIFAADPNEAARRVAELPGVVSSKVTLAWPNQVTIEIVEDTPVAIWQEGAQQYWITRYSQLIPARTPAIGLLTIEYEVPPTPSAQEVGVGEMMGGEGETAVSNAAIGFIPEDVLLGALQLRQLRPNIDKLYYRPASGLSYDDGRGWRAYFGSGTDMNQKLSVYETIVADLLSRQIQPAYISVSNQEKPYYR